MRRRKNPDTNTLLVVMALAAGGYLLYKFLQGASVVTNAAAGGLANLWVSLTSSPPMTVLGDVILPNGQDVGPLSQMTVKSDASGNVYVNVGGAVYQLQPHDAQGNWPAVPVG